MTGHLETRIRAAEPTNALTVHTLACEIAEHQDQSEHLTVTAGRWRDLLARPDVTVLLAERGDTPAGYVSAVRRLHLWTGGDVLALDDLYVRAEFRDLGIGRELMIELADRAAPEGLTITWGVQPDNEHALRFYDRLGATLRPKITASWSPGPAPD